MSILHVNKETFEEEVLHSSKPVLVDFFATWCGPCQSLGPVLEELAEERSDIKVCKIDIDGEKELTRKYRVMSVPTLMVMKDGEIVKRATGYMDKGELEELL